MKKVVKQKQYCGGLSRMYEQSGEQIGRVGQAAQYRTRESVATILREPNLRRPPRQVHGALSLRGFVCGG